MGGYTPGVSPFDALIVGCYEGRDLRFAKVRNGFVPRLRRDVLERFVGIETNKCPFVNLPEKRRTMWALTVQEMKEWIALREVVNSRRGVGMLSIIQRLG